MIPEGLKIGMRYAGSSATMAFTIFAILANMSPENQAAFMAALHQFNDSILSAYGALTKMWVIVGPALLIWMAKMGIDSGKIKAIVDRVLGVALGNTAGAPEAQKKLLEATTTILNTPNAPAASTTEVKAAVLATAISMPEVATPKIEVTSKALAEATPNENVVPAPNAA